MNQENAKCFFRLPTALKLLSLAIFISFTAASSPGNKPTEKVKSAIVLVSSQDTSKLKKEDAIELCKPLSVHESSTAQVAYMVNCHGCHGVDQMGASGPSLYKLNNRISFNQFKSVVESGRAQMPGFRLLDNKTKIALYKYLSAIPLKGKSGKLLACDTLTNP